MSTLVIFLAVVGAAYAVVKFAVEPTEPATDKNPVERALSASPAKPAKRPRHMKQDAPPLEIDESDPVIADVLAKHRQSLERATGGVDVPLRRRVRSGALLVLLLIGLGAFAAVVIALGIVGLITGLRTAIG